MVGYLWWVVIVPSSKIYISDQTPSCYAILPEIWSLNIEYPLHEDIRFVPQLLMR